MEVPVNYLAVLAGGVSNMVIGFLWYGYIFKKPWMALMGMTSDKMQDAKAQANMGKNYGIAFFGALLMSYVMSHSLVFASSYLGVSGISAGLVSGFWSWVGFVVPVTFASVLWEGKSWKLWCINSTYYLASLLVIGAILGCWR